MTLTQEKKKRYLRWLGVPNYLCGVRPSSLKSVRSVKTRPNAAARRPQVSAAPTEARGASGSQTPRKQKSSPVVRRPSPSPKPVILKTSAERPSIKMPTTSDTKYRPDLGRFSSESWVGTSSHSSQELSEWDALQKKVDACRQCPLHEQRTHAVFGHGALSAQLMLVGEAPGADEDFSGIPFVGRSGRLLTTMIEAMGFCRQDVYICNVVKCRPPDNRSPKNEEIESCADYLNQQLAFIRPKAVLALGAVAAHRLIAGEQALSKMRAVQHSYTVGEHTCALFVSYHPSYLLRKPSAKRDAWQDLKRVMKFFINHPMQQSTQTSEDDPTSSPSPTSLTDH